ncbi:hypothetical protein EYF80_048217 [Liparis tanakae]|uniref:Uncharacterized protein n=1 Tax=Liparis tanakae TaxID=230148 RepID=A0A4Z2FMS3_9TELE|nr:hypothetical protein EYF80_048217 [Liparis tanakae]
MTDFRSVTRHLRDDVSKLTCTSSATPPESSPVLGQISAGSFSNGQRERLLERLVGLMVDESRP